MQELKKQGICCFTVDSLPGIYQSISNQNFNSKHLSPNQATFFNLLFVPSMFGKKPVMIPISGRNEQT